MPDTAAKIIARLSKKADSITDAIERRQMLVDRAVAKAEKDLFSLLIADLSSQAPRRTGDGFAQGKTQVHGCSCLRRQHVVGGAA